MLYYARALGADIVICVNLNSDLAGRGTIIQQHAADPDPELVPELDVRPTSRWLGGITALSTGAVQSIRICVCGVVATLPARSRTVCSGGTWMPSARKLASDGQGSTCPDVMSQQS